MVTVDSHIQASTIMDGKVDVQDVKKQIAAEIAAATLQELVEDMTEKCYTSCVKKPASSLDNYEQRCLANCMDRFIDSYNLVSRQFTSRIENQMQNQ